jgi:hypothetical protein
MSIILRVGCMSVMLRVLHVCHAEGRVHVCHAEGGAWRSCAGAALFTWGTFAKLSRVASCSPIPRCGAFGKNLFGSDRVECDGDAGRVTSVYAPPHTSPHQLAYFSQPKLHALVFCLVETSRSTCALPINLLCMLGVRCMAS